MNSSFEIHAPGLDTEKLAREVEDRLAARGLDPDEVERIRDLSFTPVSPAAGKGFDPPLTADLFERSVPTPDFRNKKYRFLIWPLRGLATAVFKLFAQLHDKLSDNKVQAFYNVVHELIALRHRYDGLRLRFNSIVEDHLHLQRMVATTDAVRGTVPKTIPERSDEQAARDRQFFESTWPDLSLAPGADCFILDDAWGDFSAEAVRAGLTSVRGNAERPEDALYREQTRKLKVVPGAADIALATLADESLDLIVDPNLESASGNLELRPLLYHRKLRPGGALVLRYAPLPTGPLSRPNRVAVDREALDLLLCSPEGGSLVPAPANQPNEDGPFQLVYRKP